MFNDPSDEKSTSSRAFGVIKRSVVIRGRKTSLSLEDAFWSSLKDIADRRSTPLSALIGTIEQERTTANMSSAVRLFVLDYFQTKASANILIGQRIHTSRLN